MEEKTPRQSYTEQAHILLAEHINGAGRLFGGTLLSWIDVTAAIAARRHSGHDVTTVCIDNLAFLAPAHINDTVVVAARVTWVGHTSMEIQVDTFVETLRGERVQVNRAYLVMVAMDEHENPCAVPPLRLETEEDVRLWNQGAAHSRMRRERRKTT